MPVEKITVRGEKSAPTSTTQPTDDLTELKASYRIGASVRGRTETHPVTLEEEDLIELIFEDDTVWYSNSSQLEELFPEAAQQSRSLGGEFELPSTLPGEAGERGVVSDVALKVLNIFVKKQVQGKVKELAKDLEKKQLQNYSGLYQLNRDFRFKELSAEPSQSPYLLFIHGTSSSTSGSFGGLMGTEVWDDIEQAYGKQVLAFQHETLSKSPLENAYELVESLLEKIPQSVELHLITHSRGGLVGDVLSRFSNHDPEQLPGFTKEEIDCLRKAGREADLEYIEKLRSALKDRRIVVSKFVRVACPGSGTTLASQRLDNLLNIIMNLVGFGTGAGANPFYAGFKNLIAAAMDSKNKVEVLPGLEAMNPKSPFIKILNSRTHPGINSPVQVVSGNCTIKPELRALLILASKFFYWRDNDLVVDTHSMYQGVKRGDKMVQFFFDEVGKVDHFQYFRNERTRRAIRDALATQGSELAPGFRLIEQDLIIRGERQALLKLEDGRLMSQEASGRKPIVVLLPGLMGSNLSKDNTELWINYWRFVWGKLVSLDIDNEGIEALSAVKTSYGKLAEYLSDEYDVVVYPYDWRKSLTETADRLEEKIRELLALHQPIKVIAHSMGGVLMRDFILHHPQTWKRLNAIPGFRLLFLGTPLGGSFRIPAVLCGRDAILNKLDQIDIFHNRKELIEVFARFPGLLNLLPLTTDPDNDFADQKTWERITGPLGEWPRPQESDLLKFGKYRKTVREGLEQLDYSNMVYIAGQDKATPCGYRIEKTTEGDELIILSTGEGDQSVTWKSGIPQPMIDNDAVYYVPVTHGALANDSSIFGGIADILAQGATRSLSRTRPVVRSGQKLFRAPEPFDFDLSPRGVEQTILGLDSEEPATPAETPVSVSMNHGNLRYATYPVLAGHFRHDGILYAEESIDQYLQGALAERHQLGLYPGEIGSSEVMVQADGDFRGAIIVGLGKFGELTTSQLTQTVEQGLTRYLLDLNSSRPAVGTRTNQPAGPLGLSSLIIGCGYGGLTIENSIGAVIQGVQRANRKIMDLRAEGARLIQTIEFIEIYEDTALSGFYSLRRIARRENNPLNITVASRIRTLFGSRQRLPIQEREGWWKKLTVQQKEVQEVIPEEFLDPSEDPGERSPKARMVRCLLFSASTGGAREEQRELFTSTPIVEQLVDRLSTHSRWDRDLAKTLYELLIPNDFKDAFQKQGNINWILDKHTAAYPWELLQDSTQQAKPMCVNAGMIRQLSTQDYRLMIKAVANNKALVVGDPQLEGFVSQLPGALKEGRMVDQLLTEKGFDAVGIMNATAPDIIQALFRDDYKIIHLAGHGFFDEKHPQSSGMVIGKNVFLSTREICQMGKVPELVFVNCCHLGRADGVAEAFYRKRYRLAANIGVQLIENGVKAVVAAGWAVDDQAALDFTQVFYESMFEGYTFGDAVLKARQLIYSKYPHTNTWGAYQCYGDPFYKFRDTRKEEKAYSPEFIIPQQAEIELNNLREELDTGSYTTEEFLQRLATISRAVDQAGLRDARITEQEALIYADAGHYDQALKKFDSLLVMEKAAFSVTSLEKFCNIRAKNYVQKYLDPKDQTSRWVQPINEVIEDLKYLLKVSATAERHSLLGSTYKRKALVSNKSYKENAYSDAAYHYREAHFVVRNTYSAYTLTNWLEMEQVLHLHGGKRWGSELTGKNGESFTLPTFDGAVAELEEALVSLNTPADHLDYWDLVAKANILLCLRIMHPDDEDAGWSPLTDLFRTLWRKAGSRGKRVAEVEHLEILTDALKWTQTPAAEPLYARLTELKDELQRII